MGLFDFFKRKDKKTTPCTDDAIDNGNVLVPTPEMYAEIKESVLPRLKSEYNITSADNDFDEVDLDWVCGGVSSLSWNFDFGLNKEDFKTEYDYDIAIAEKWELYFHNSEEQCIINMIWEMIYSGELFD